MSFFRLSVLCIALIQLSCYLEEWIFKALPGFHYHWTVALVELLFFTVAGWCGARGKRAAPLTVYAGIGCSLAAGTGLGKLAYRYLNFATGTVLKSMKLVPVILISTCCMRRRYSAAEYVAASLMIISAALFGLGEAKVEPDFNILGLVLSFACLMAQAVQNNLQDHALRDYSVSIHESMYYGNGAALGWVLLICIGTGELLPSFDFFAASPQAMALLLLRSLLFYLGAYVYQLLLKDSGAVYAVAVMTLRKSLTVLLSFALFPKPWSSSYGWGLVLLGAAIAIDLRMRWRRDAAPTTSMPLLEKEPR